MIELFEKPRKITIKQFAENMRNDCNLKYIQRFNYGEDDNNVDAVIDSLDISLKYTYKVETHITLGECYNISVKTPFKFLSNVKSKGYEQADMHCGFEDFYAKTFEDFLNMETEIIGVYKDE